MKKLFSSRKLKSVFRTALCLLLILSCSTSLPGRLYAAEDDLKVGMKWTRLRSNADMKKYLGEANDKNLNSVNDWSRVLIISPNGKYYVKNENLGYDDDELLCMERITGTMGIKSGSDSFITRSDLGATSMKIVGYDDEHSGYEVYIRPNTKLGTDSKTSLSDNCVAINLSWYGVAWSAAAYSEFEFAPVSNPSSAEDRASCACSASIRYTWTISFGKSYKIGSKTISRSAMRLLEVACSHYARDNDYYDEDWFSLPIYGGSYTYTLEEALQNAGRWWVSSSRADESIVWEGLDDEAYGPAPEGGYEARNGKTYDKMISEEYFKNTIMPAVWDYAHSNEDVYQDYAMITFNTGTKNVHDRTWNFEEGDAIELCKGEGDASSISFMLYYGEAAMISILITNQEFVAYGNYYISDYTINNSVQLRVNKGATLVIDGTCYNNGRIVVDGGTLVIKGCLDSDTSQSDGEFTDSGTSEKYRPGDILLKNGATLIVEEGASLLHRNPGAELRAQNGCLIQSDGLMVVANALIIDGSQLRAGNDTLTIIGFEPVVDKGADEYDMAYIIEHKGDYLDGYVKESKFSDNSVFGTRRSGEKGFIIKNKGSYISYGGTVVLDRSSVSITSDSYFKGKESFNFHASISSMLNDEW